MNKVFLIGNLTRDPELTETNGGVKICRFSIAVNRNRKGADGEYITDFFNCVAWRDLAEVIARYKKKGDKVCVSGSIEIRNYEDSQGIKRTGVDIVAQDVEFLTSKSNGNSDDFGYDAPAASGNSGKGKPQLQPFDDDSDIPF